MLWANFLHFYQPPDQRRYMMERIVNEGYRPLITVIRSHPKARCTFNISGCLLDKLAKFGMDDVIEGFRQLVRNGQVELTASAKYHPFLPLVKPSEIVRQIRINNDTLRYYFKDLYKPKGFFSPEAGYSRALAELVSSLGYQWIIADEIAYSGHLSTGGYDFSHTCGFYSGGLALHQIVGTVTFQSQKFKSISKQKSSLTNDQSSSAKSVVDYSRLYRLKDVPDFTILFRERVISDAIASGQIRSAKQFLSIVKPEFGKRRYLLTGTDGEAYGHHQPGLEKVLDAILAKKDFHTVTISRLLKEIGDVELVDPIPSTWGTSEKEICDGFYYSRWLDPRNKIHKMQWDLTNLAIEAVEEAKGRGDIGYPKARKLLDKALYSCHFWWATARPWWSIEIIERGSKYLLSVVQALQGPPSNKKDKQWRRFVQVKRKAKMLYSSIVFTAFDWLRDEVVKDLSHTHK